MRSRPRMCSQTKPCFPYAFSGHEKDKIDQEITKLETRNVLEQKILLNSVNTLRENSFLISLLDPKRMVEYELYSTSQN